MVLPCLVFYSKTRADCSYINKGMLIECRLETLHKDPRAWSLADLENVCTLYGHIGGVTVVLKLSQC